MTCCTVLFVTKFSRTEMGKLFKYPMKRVSALKNTLFEASNVTCHNLSFSLHI